MLLYSQQYLCDLTDIIIHIVAVGKQDVLIKLRAIMKCLEAYVPFVLAETTTRNYRLTVLLEISISVQQRTVWYMVITIISLDTVLKFLMMFSDPDQQDYFQVVEVPCSVGQ